MSNDLTKLWLADQKHSPLTPAASGSGGGGGGGAGPLGDALSALVFNSGEHTLVSGQYTEAVDTGSLGGTWDKPASGYDGLRALNYGGDVGTIATFQRTWNTTPIERNVWSVDTSASTGVDLYSNNIDWFFICRRNGTRLDRGVFQTSSAGRTVLGYKASSGIVCTSTGGTVTSDGGSALTTEGAVYTAINTSTFRLIRIADCPCTGWNNDTELYFGGFNEGFTPEDLEIIECYIFNSSDVDSAVIAELESRRDTYNGV